ncbi:MAG: tetratricopeptide repeat protein [Gammaproteobacteria bacterium]|nr:tetratricopeptide repeat protein [Gammaproteobacteria bacterium]
MHRVSHPLEAAMAAHRAGRLEDADRLYRRAVEADPGDVQALRLRGILARERGDLDASSRLLGRAAEVAAPGDAAPLAERALTRLAAHDLDGALADLRAALGRDPDHGRALANLGALLQYRGHLLEAIVLEERALQLDAGDIDVRCNLAKALAETGRGTEALVLCDAGLAVAPAHPQLLATRGAVCCDIGDFAAAVSVLDGAVARNPDDDSAWVSLAFARAQCADHAAAMDALRAARRANPHNARATADLLNLLAGTGRGQDALDLAGEFLATHPGERHVLAALGFALRDAGDIAAADALVDHDHAVSVSAVELPLGLGAGLLADPSLVDSPASKATRGGRQSGELDLSSPPLAAFAALLKPAIAAHPAMAEGPAHWSLRAWTTVLTAGGHQLPHIHPEAWLSGVCYVDVPAMGAGQAGWIEFGAPPPRFLIASAPPRRAVEPIAGRLVLFPSYFHHRTLPFAAAGTRVSVAFDVVAA